MITKIETGGFYIRSMKQLKKSDIPLLISIKEKECHIEQIEKMLVAGLTDDELSSNLSSQRLKCALWEQLEILNQIKRLESSIYNDR